MEKTIQLDQKEIQAHSEITRELTLAWAQIGVMMEQLDQARRARDQLIEKQRALIKQAVTDRGINKFENARLIENTIMLNVEESYQAGVN